MPKRENKKFPIKLGIDEACLDVSQKVKGDFDEAKELLQKVKEEVKAQENLTCSIGGGPNKLVAKIVSSTQACAT